MLRRLLFHNFRLVHRLGQHLQRRLTPAGVLVLAGLVATGVFGLDPRQTLAYQLFALLAALLLAAALAVLTLRPRVELHRALPRFATAGQSVHYRIRLRCAGRRAESDLTLADRLQEPRLRYEEFRGARSAADRKRNLFDRLVGYPRWLELLERRRGGRLPEVPIPTLEPGEILELPMALEPLRRGYLHFDHSELRQPDPLGLINALARFHNPQSLLVLPRRYPLPALGLPGTRRYQPGGVELASAVGESQEVVALRDYRPGDPLRRIHWRSWAKTGRPIVKEFQDEFFVRHALILDTFLGAAGDTAFEEAVSVAASFAAGAWPQDALIDLMLVGERSHHLTAGRGLAGTAELLEVLACVEAADSRRFPLLARLAAEHAPRLSAAVCVLLAWDAPRRELVQRLRAGGLPLLVMVVTEDLHDPDPGPMADQPSCFAILRPPGVAAGLAALAPDWSLRQGRQRHG